MKCACHRPRPVKPRQIVAPFNQQLERRVREEAALEWVDIAADMVVPRGGGAVAKLRPEFELDGTHLSPKYLGLLGEGLSKLERLLVPP